ncbi:NADPH oxidase 5 [Zerene cesonia]|uniref:NADPH oxidase 5 n=1 Tax=Zerene cesonia TaxID=33412 RepID=UPI0018E524AA|nr:NADPH oxidase 5 [Zerene cesonia]XP_038218085.1 NADPH oxidase 5 [Zerene cesonia]
MSTDDVTIKVDSSEGGKNDSDVAKMADFDRIQNASKDLLGLPRNGHRRSFMEEESAKERTRAELLKQCSAILKQGDQRYNKDSLHRTFQDEDFLDRIFRLFDVEANDHLVQEDWIEFLKIRLTDEKQLDFVEQVESVAYVLCGDEVITPEAFKLILKNKVVTKKFLRVVDTDGDGWATAEEIMDFLSAVTTNRPRAGIDKPSVDRLEKLFRDTVGDEKEITREQFQKIMVSKNPFFTERVFQIFDEDNSGTISQREFIAAVHRFGRQSPEEKIRFLFKVYDLDGDGLIQHRELLHVMRACMHENGMQFSPRQLLELTAALFDDAGGGARGAITCDDLRAQLARHPGLIDNLSISIDRWLVPPQPARAAPLRARARALWPHQLTLAYIRNNFALVGYLLAFFCVNFALFVARLVEYWHSNVFVMLARACGQCLNLTASWVLVLMLRRSLTALRSLGLGARLPLDHHVYLHKLTGVLLVAYSALHTLMHLCNFCLVVVNDPQLNAQNWTTWEWLGTARPRQFGLAPGAANPTGLALCAALLVLAACSAPAVRRGGCFEVFYFTHLLYIPFWALLIVHAPNFWKWFIAPGTIYVIERILRLSWTMSERGKTYIASGVLLPSRVTQLVVRRPPLFHFRAGDYVFVCVPAVARYEWHPFTVSSAPEQEDYIWLHIRGVGEWTNRLYSYFEQEQLRLQGHTKCRSNSTQSKSSRKGDASPLAFDNDAFCCDDGTAFKALSPVQIARQSFLSPLKKIEKSSSMPDVFNDVQSKQKTNTPPVYLRSESAQCMSEHAGGAGGAGGGGGGGGGAAHSVRHMRRKPAVIDCAPPARRGSGDSLFALARRRFSKSRSPERDVENELRVHTEESPSEAGSSHYPVGKPLEIYLDGPYGAASSNIMRAQHAVLVAAGIGVTPFASLLQSVLLRHARARAACPRCGHAWPDPARHGMSLNKVDFFWINREQRSFEWFVSLLSQLEIDQAAAGGARFLEMHMYITSALQRADMRALGLQLALDLLHDKGKRDLITGLKTRTNAGRPNWDKVFQRLAAQRRGKVSVFYCGPPLLARSLRAKCDQFGFHFRKEVF